MKGEDVIFVAPLGHELWFKSGGIPSDQVVELDWHDSVDLRISERHPAVKFVCTPAQHGSGTSVILFTIFQSLTTSRVGRHLFDQRASLWSSWVVKQGYNGASASVYHAG